MEVNGLKLPESFVQFCKAEQANGRSYHPTAAPQGRIDAYGHPLDANFSIWTEGFEEGTAWFREIMERQEEGVTPEDIRELQAYTAANQPEWVFLIMLNEFSKIVCIGVDDMCNPLAFDFRENLSQPSVIYGPGGFWRRLAPSFDSFIALFEPQYPDPP